MKLLRLSALTIALSGFAAVQADEAPSNPSVSAAGVAAVQTQQMWSSFDTTKSSLLPQARAVFRALRRESEPEGGVEVVRMAANNTVARTESDERFCRHMGTPDSRIMSRRCFDLSPSEAEFDKFQYQAEIEEAFRLQDEYFLEHAEYSLAYRRSLAQGGPME